MVEVVYPQEDSNPVVVELRDPYWSAFLAWLFPGAGHFYQRRFGKGFLFMICVLGTFFFGLGLGRGRVVYASFDKADFRWQYICQVGAGAVSFPAIIQALKTKEIQKEGRLVRPDPFFVLCERYPESSPLRFQTVTDRSIEKGYPRPDNPFKDGFMAPPAGPKYQNDMDVLGMWNFEMKHMFEIGTLYCVVAGLLNLLAIYDAFCGPAILTPEQKAKLESKKRRKPPSVDPAADASEKES